MDTNTFNLWSIAFMFVNILIAILGIILVIFSIRSASQSIRKSIENYSYDVWRTVYDKLIQYPEGTQFFDFKTDDTIDLKSLSIFLMILDMYANKFCDDYSKMSLLSTPNLLQKMMKSEISQKYWNTCKNHFFSDQKFIQEVDKIISLSTHR